MARRRAAIVLLVAGAALLTAAAVTLYLRFAAHSSGPPAATTQEARQASVSLEPEEELAGYCSGIKASSDPFFGTQQRTRLLEELERPSFQSHSWAVSIRLELARDHLRFGEAEEAIGLLAEALEMEERTGTGGTSRAVLLEALAVANLKLGELNNCLSPTGRLLCALPLDRSLAYADKRGPASAIGYLMQLLEMDPQHLKARWLLNVAHMALDTYPEGVPDDYLIPRSALATEYAIGRFEEIAPDVGIYAVNPAGGSIIEDFDNDGLLDILTSTSDPCGPIIYYRNDGNGRFSEYTHEAGLDGQLGGLNIVQADYNNDGWMDVLVLRGGWMRERGQMRMSLLRNDGGVFTDVTREAGIAYPAYPRQSTAWGDYDNDGYLDLFVCNESMPESGAEGGGMRFPSQLFHNEGDGTFTDVGPIAGVINMRYCKGSAWGDYDNDGDPDLYVSNFGGENRLYRNNGDGTFTDVAPELGTTEPLDSFATWFWDYDNDGWLDLFVAGYGTEVADVAADYLGLPNDGPRPRLYRNDGRGGFADVTRQAGLYRVHLAMGANFGDLDNDGFLDFYLGTGAPSFDALSPNIMYRNNAGASFTDVTFSGGFGHLQKGHGVSFGDLDRDGDQDIFVQVGGFYPGDGFVSALYRNPGHGNRWLSVKLEGVMSNRAGVGARLKVVVEERGGFQLNFYNSNVYLGRGHAPTLTLPLRGREVPSPCGGGLGWGRVMPSPAYAAHLDAPTPERTRTIYINVGSGGSFGASSFEQHIGLGQAERIVSLEVYWPTSGTRQVFDDVPLNSHIQVREGENVYSILLFTMSKPGWELTRCE